MVVVAVVGVLGAAGVAIEVVAAHRSRTFPIRLSLLTCGIMPFDWHDCAPQPAERIED